MGGLYGNSAESVLVDYMVRLKLPPLDSDRSSGGVKTKARAEVPKMKSGPLSTVEVRIIGTVISHEAINQRNM
jgi:hypothetical protein